MVDLQGPPITHANYQDHLRALGGTLRNVPLDDRADLLQAALLRAVPRWDPTRSPWHPWIIRVLRGEVARYCRDRRPGRSPLPADLPARDLTSQISANIDCGLLLDRLPPRQQRAITARKGGSVARRARLQLRQLAHQEVSR